jgi:hypothetical protein
MNDDWGSRLNNASRSIDLPPGIRRVLDGVRRRIRAYIWVEGLAILAVLLGAAFWAGLAADWMFEPSPRVRRMGLMILGFAAAYVFYRYLLRRALVRITDASAAALLERRFPALGDHVLTAVDVASQPERAAAYHPELMYETQRSAAHAVAGVDPAKLFNRGPMIKVVGAAALLGLSIAAFALLSQETFGFWLKRITLSNEPWPRRVHLEVVGFPADAVGRRTHKLAQDDDFELLVHASTAGYEVPQEVEIRFRLADGRRGRDTMIRVGEAEGSRDNFQLFRYQFKRIAGNMEFDVVGGDDRVRDLRLQVVERPELFAIELECVYPEYIGREPRRLPVTGGMRIPEGAQLVLHAGATKPLTAARILRANNQQEVRIAFDREPQDKLRWEYGTLSDDDVLLVSVTDTDGVVSREPYRVSLAAVRDELPQIAVRLAGIGTAITPDAVLPLVGKITDDYGLDRAWFDFKVDSDPPVQRPLIDQPTGDTLLDRIDSFDLRAADPATGQLAIELKPGQRFTLTLKAADRFNLTDAPRAGSSQQFSLDVVTPGDLLALLERRELALRQRFESIFEKMTDTRNLLARVDDGKPTDATVSQPIATDNTNAAPTTDAPGDESLPAAQRALARRRLRVAGSLQNVVQSADEVAGVAEAFDDLGDQLTNNRIDNPDLKSRLREQIALPLHRIAGDNMPQLAAQLKLVQEQIENPTAARPELAKSIRLADEVLVEMRQVLDRMLELETYNEVVALLRGIIKDQDEISRQTKEQQQERLRNLFEDD